MSTLEETSASRYVKLGKEQDVPVEEIRPGELNQPVHVPQLVVHKCGECGQPLPDSYKPPSNEPWTTGIFGCGEDMDSCELSFLLLHNLDPSLISFTYLIFYFVLSS
jgi:hypothetical protein